ncbi:carbon-nitrogen hydrolase family protein [Alteromonadaceae bacterium BrNp21-10]|nr:carbon-nitrogen hydrolase family protein [Alteromonadaceae bacterium BrNp21-10]
MANIAALQMCSSTDVQGNLDRVEHYLKQLVLTQPMLVVLPECFVCFGGADKALLNITESRGQGPIQTRLANMAAQYGVWLVAGTIPLWNQQQDKFTASCLIFNAHGEVVSEYQKIHLFDVNVADNTGRYHESKYTQAGQQVVVFDSPFGRVGVAVCYDLRFPTLFQAMQDIDVIALPSAFTYATGKAHWQPLLQARSIEKQCYVVAANQSGEHENGRCTYGHSQIWSPWGELLAEKPQGEGVISAIVDPQYLAQIRQNMPIRAANKELYR